MKAITIILFILLTQIVYSQNTIGFPSVISYSKFEYNGGLQSWDIKQDSRGIIYFANNEGVITYDGVYWKNYPLPNKTIVRSLYIDDKNKIYVGGQDELGYFESTSEGKLAYVSLLANIPLQHRKFGDVWDIIPLNQSIFVRTDEKIFQITPTEVKTYKALTQWRFLGILDKKVIAQDAKQGLYYLQEDTVIQNQQPLSLPFRDDVTGIIQQSTNAKALLTTIKNGLYTIKNGIITSNKNLSYLKNDRVYKATLVDSTTIALATSYNGVYIIDFEGNEKQHFSKKEGLQTNNVLSVFTDKQKNIWLGLDNGIDFIAYNSAIKLIDPNQQNTSAYTALYKNQQLYIGTSSGLFSTPIQSCTDISFCRSNFILVPNTSGQVWSLADMGNTVFMGHHEGAFSVSKNSAKKIEDKTGFWNFVQYKSNTQRNQLVGGTYKGLSFLRSDPIGYVVKDSILHFNESSRYIAVDEQGTIWVSHPYHGVFSLSAQHNEFFITTFTANDGLPSTLNNHIFKLRNQIVVATIKGIYVYNSDTKKFEASRYYQHFFGTMSLRYLKEDRNNNIWFISEKQLGVVDLNSKNKQLLFFPELNNRLLSGFEYVYPYNDNNVFIAGANGLYNINYEKYKTNNEKLPILITNVTITNKYDSTLFGGYAVLLSKDKDVVEISSNWKLIRFQYATPSYGHQANIEYSYQLSGFDKTWSEWTKRTEKEYTNLPAGSYTFQVKVKNNLGIESAIATYTFTILPPWYLSKLAYLIYFILLCLVIYILVKWQKNKFRLQQKKYDEEQQKLLYILDLERNKKESEIIALQNEKLATEVSFQTTELATSAMHLVKKGELISKIKENLAQVIKVSDSAKIASEIKKITKALNEDENMDKDWEHFSKHFDKVHSDFLTILKERHPTITPNELKLSAYLRMNLSTKEIAQLLNISVRGVEISRYRLRKKLALGTAESLFEYLIKIT